MITIATVFGVLLFLMGIFGVGGEAIIPGCILLGAAMISVQIARLTASIEKQKK